MVFVGTRRRQEPERSWTWETERRVEWWTGRGSRLTSPVAWFTSRAPTGTASRTTAPTSGTRRPSRSSTPAPAPTGPRWTARPGWLPSTPSPAPSRSALPTRRRPRPAPSERRRKRPSRSAGARRSRWFADARSPRGRSPGSSGWARTAGAGRSAWSWTPVTGSSPPSTTSRSSPPPRRQWRPG